MDNLHHCENQHNESTTEVVEVSRLRGRTLAPPLLHLLQLRHQCTIRHRRRPGQSPQGRLVAAVVVMLCTNEMWKGTVVLLVES